MYLFFILNLSAILDEKVSTSEMLEDIPAKTSEPKNITANRLFIPGRAFIALGNTIKANPTPALATSCTGTPCDLAIYPNMLNTAIPDNKLKLQLPKPVMNALFTISDSLGRFV